MQLIPRDGGRLPGAPAGKPPRAAQYHALSPAQRRAWRLALKPQFTSVANQAARVALTTRVPGDYCRQTDSGLYRLRALPASTEPNWDLIHPF